MSLQLTKAEELIFWESVKKTDECWFWKGATNKGGYGIYPNSSNEFLTHRISFRLLICDIPKSKPELDHLCYVRQCCNPSHMLPTTRIGNLRTRRQKRNYFGKNYDLSSYCKYGKDEVIELRRTHCHKNHELKYMKVTPPHKLQCVDCVKDKERLDLRNWDVLKLDTNLSSEQFLTDFSKSYSGMALNAVKQLLLEKGINTYSKPAVLAKRFLEIGLEKDFFTIGDLIQFFNLKPTITKFRSPRGY